MENVKIISDNGIEINVNGLFYIFNSRYYFIYTIGEVDENGYVKLYVVQVCKEVQNTPNGPVDTGYMLGMEIPDAEEWGKVQESITKIVEDKKNGTQNPEIQYLPMNMLVNLKIVSKNKFKLMKHIVEFDFKVVLPNMETEEIEKSSNINLDVNIISNDVSIDDARIQAIQPTNDEEVATQQLQNITNTVDSGEVIIDYRTKFFEEQEKNQALQEQIRLLQEKIENIKNIIG